jgi:hypothetical protein
MWKDTSPTHLYALQTIRAAPGPLRECYSPWLDVSFGALIKVKDFWRFLVSCGLINNSNWRVVKLGTCVVKVVCLLCVKYCTVTVLIVECNISAKLKNRSFLDKCLYEFFFFVLLRRTQSWISAEYFTHILCFVCLFVCLFVFLALQPIVGVLSTAQ